MAELKTCIVCGAQSHRDSWINVSGDYVACDFHSKTDVEKAIAASQEKAAEVETKPVDVAPVKPPAPPSAPAAVAQANTTPAPTAPQSGTLNVPAATQADATKA